MTHNKGFVVILATMLVLLAGLVIVLSAGYISLSNIKAVRNNIYSVQAYYAAEAGIEDALLRLIDPVMDDPNPGTYSLTVGEAEATFEEITPDISGSYTIISKGDKSNRIRKVKTVLAITTTDISFHYGVQVGGGGMTMENNSEIYGNVFSNGSVVGKNGRGKIKNTIKVATEESEIKGLIITEDAYAHNCEDCDIGGNFYYSGGAQVDCGDTISSSVQGTKDLPIENIHINGWMDEAVAGGDPLPGYTVENDITLGPKKIEGDLIVKIGKTLTLTGTLWVTGIITIYNGATIKLHSNYGSTSGVMVAGCRPEQEEPCADGIIDVRNGAILLGSEEDDKSYIMLLTTNGSTDFNDPAIHVKNTTEGAIFYASAGVIRLGNVEIKEATGYALYLDNGAIVEYDSGLADAQFASGPGAGYEVAEWGEI